ncbi:MAG: hypothetical protein ABIB79_05265 [archaeon]
MKHKAQVTIFIIVAIMIVALIIMFFLLRSKLPSSIGGKPEVNPNAFLQTCLEDKVKETINLISEQGGYTEPKLYRTFKFEDKESYKNFSYLCYTMNNYLPCINQEPMLIQHLKNEIHDYIKDDVDECYSNLGMSLRDRGYVVDARYNGFDVNLQERKIIIKINGNLKLTKSGETTPLKDFKTVFSTRFYDLAIVVHEIISQEAEYCHFDVSGFSLFYPKFKIDKFRTSDLETIYTVEHRDSGERFRFAVRGCVIPPGI